MKDQTHPPALTAPGEGGGAPALTRPTLASAARALAELERPFEGEGTRGLAAGRLLDSLRVEGVGEAQLHLQIRTLDALYNRLVIRALRDTRQRPKHTDTTVDADYALLALQAQRQCSHAVEMLAALENRKSKNRLKDAPI